MDYKYKHIFHEKIYPIIKTDDIFKQNFTFLNKGILNDGDP
jgi:hypothetical protein